MKAVKFITWICSPCRIFADAEDQRLRPICLQFGLFGALLHAVETPFWSSIFPAPPPRIYIPRPKQTIRHMCKWLLSKTSQLLTLADLYCRVQWAIKHNLLDILVYVMLCSSWSAWVFASSSSMMHVLWGMLFCVFWQLHGWRNCYAGSLGHLGLFEIKMLMFLGFLGFILFTLHNQLPELMCIGKSPWLFWYNFPWSSYIGVTRSRYTRVRQEGFTFSQFG